MLLTEEIRHQILLYGFSYRFWACINKIHCDSLSVDEEAFFDATGMTTAPCSYSTENRGPFINALETSLAKNPVYRGLCRILTGYVINGRKTTKLRFEELPDFSDPIDMGNKLLLRLASNQLGDMSPIAFVDEVLNLADEENNLHGRITRVARNHDLEGDWIEKMLVNLYKRLPCCHSLGGRDDIRRYLGSLYRKHTSTLAETPTRQALALPLIDFDPGPS